MLKDIEKFGYRTELKDDYVAKFQFESESTPLTLAYAEEAAILYPGGKTADKANGFSQVQSRLNIMKKTDCIIVINMGQNRLMN